MKFYDSIGLPNPDRVRIALAEKGVLDQVEIIQVDLWKGEHRTEAFKAKNPSVTVPLLELANGVAISETTAMCGRLRIGKDYLNFVEPLLVGAAMCPAC